MSAISVNKIKALVNNVDPETLLFSLIKYIKPEVFIYTSISRTYIDNAALRRSSGRGTL